MTPIQILQEHKTEYEELLKKGVHSLLQDRLLNDIRELDAAIKVLEGNLRDIARPIKLAQN